MNITKKEFKDYVKVQRSGKTNMFHRDMVTILTGLNRDKIIHIQKEYESLAIKYPDVLKV